MMFLQVLHINIRLAKGVHLSCLSESIQVYNYNFNITNVINFNVTNFNGNFWILFKYIVINQLWNYTKKYAFLTPNTTILILPRFLCGYYYTHA